MSGQDFLILTGSTALDVAIGCLAARQIEHDY